MAGLKAKPPRLSADVTTGGFPSACTSGAASLRAVWQPACTAAEVANSRPYLASPTVITDIDGRLAGA